MKMQVNNGSAHKEQEIGMVASVVRAEAERSLMVFGVQVDLLLTGKETGGAYALYRLIVAPGTGAPPHIHTGDDEAFTVVEGTIECGLGDRVVTLGAGETVALPRGIPHYFRGVGETPAIVYGVASPAGHEKFFEDAARMAFPPDPAEAMAICTRHGIELLPPPAFATE